MITALKWAAALVIGVVAEFLLAHGFLEPLRCSVLQKSIENSIAADFDAPDRFRVPSEARRNLERTSRCTGEGPNMAGMLMVNAANLRLLGRYSEAVDAYREALRFDRRPEIYLQLGFTELEAGKPDDAVSDLARAATFDPRLLREISDPLVKERVDTIVRASGTVPGPLNAGPLPRLITGGSVPRSYPAGALAGSTGVAAGPFKSARLLFDDAGWLIYGPGEDLPAGRYRVHFRLKLDSISRQEVRPVAKLDVTSEGGANVRAALEILPTELTFGEWRVFTLNFESAAPLRSVEYRIYWHGTTDLTCSEVKIDRY